MPLLGAPDANFIGAIIYYLLFFISYQQLIKSPFPLVIMMRVVVLACSMLAAQVRASLLRGRTPAGRPYFPSDPAGRVRCRKHLSLAGNTFSSAASLVLDMNNLWRRSRFCSDSKSLSRVSAEPPYFSQAFQLPKLPAMQQQMNKAAAAATAAAVTFSSEAAHAKSVIGVNGALDFGPLAGDQPGGEGTGKVRAAPSTNGGKSQGGVHQLRSPAAAGASQVLGLHPLAEACLLCPHMSSRMQGGNAAADTVAASTFAARDRGTHGRASTAACTHDCCAQRPPSHVPQFPLS